MLLWLPNIDFAASSQNFILPDSVTVEAAGDVTIESATVVTVQSAPDITIQVD
jgi:hypothetical protein